MEAFVEKIEGNTRRYLHLFADKLDELVPVPTEAAEPDIADILAMHRQQRTQDASTGVSRSRAPSLSKDACC